MSHARGPLAIVIAFLVAQTALAQDSSVFVRRSVVPTPPVLDVEVLRQQRVDIPSVSILSNPRQSAVLQLDLFSDVSFRAVRERLEPTAHGMSWVGKLDGYPESDAFFVLVQDELIGHIYTPFGFFRIERQRDGSYLVLQVDQTGASTEDDVRVLPDADRSAVPSDHSSSRDDRWSTRADDGSVVDVLVAYTREALNGFGSEARALATIDLIVAETNQAFRNSRIRTQIRLVHTTVVDYTETADGSLAAIRLQDTRDGFMDDIHGLRDRVAADLVALITERLAKVNGESICGVGNAERNSTTGELLAPHGFSATKRSCTQNGRTFAHELGHNFGASHDWYVDDSKGWRDAHAYQKGYVSLPGRFLDVMAYSDLCTTTRISCTYLLAFSNPDLTHNGRRTGVPVGTNVTCTKGNANNPDCDADLARTFTESSPIVAQFRHSLTALTARQLLPGASFRSSNGRFRLTYQADGNLVLYDDRDAGALWSTNTGGTAAGQAILQTDGNLVVYDQNGAALWTSQTSGNANTYLVVEDDGNLAIYGSDGQLVWDRIGSPVPENWVAPAASASVLGIDFRVFNGNIVQIAIEHRIDNIGGVPGNTCTARVSQTNIAIPIVDGKFTVPFSVDGLSTVVSGTFTSPTAGTGTVDAFRYVNWRCSGTSGMRNGVLAGITPISFSRR